MSRKQISNKSRAFRYCVNSELNGLFSKTSDSAFIKDMTKKYLNDINKVGSDGDEMINDWFSKEKFDIFISHSHNDQSKAIEIAQRIENSYNKKCFIDSCVWHYADDLLRILDEKYCKNTDDTYDYNKRNLTTSHVHIMLATSLVERIRRCEKFIFIESKNSITDIKIDESIRTCTYSPWLRLELIEAVELNRPVRPIMESVQENFDSYPKVYYRIDDYLEDLVSENDLDNIIGYVGVIQP
jgi:hypothetical protein